MIRLLSKLFGKKYKNVNIIKTSDHSIVQSIANPNTLQSIAAKCLLIYTINRNDPKHNDGNNFVYAKKFEKHLAAEIDGQWLGYEQKTDIEKFKKSIEVKLGSDSGKDKNNSDIQYSQDVIIDNSKRKKDKSDIYIVVRLFSNDEMSVCRIYIFDGRIWRDIPGKKNKRNQRIYKLNQESANKDYCIFFATVTLSPIMENEQIKRQIKNMNVELKRVENTHYKNILKKIDQLTP